MEKQNEKEIFAVRPCNEEQTQFIITVGNHLATEKRFLTREKAENYISKKNWDMIVALVAEMIELTKENRKEDEK